MLALLSGYEIWIVLAVTLLLFGHRLPGMARAIGSSIVEFREGLSGNTGTTRVANESSADDRPQA